MAKVKRGEVNLDDPATTLALIKLDAVLGVKGTFNADGSLKAVGLSCAVCHSTVDDAFMPGVGHRLDGWPNRDLNTGAIISLAPDLSVFTKLLQVDEATVKKVLASWGPGKFDAELNLDGKAFRPDGKPAATLIPPAFGMAGVNLHTWTGGWGTVTYWNAFVGNLELQGQGTFFDRRLNDRVGRRSHCVDSAAVDRKLCSAWIVNWIGPDATAGGGLAPRPREVRGRAARRELRCRLEAGSALPGRGAVQDQHHPSSGA